MCLRTDSVIFLVSLHALVQKLQKVLLCADGMLLLVSFSVYVCADDVMEFECAIVRTNAVGALLACVCVCGSTDVVVVIVNERKYPHACMHVHLRAITPTRACMHT